MADAPTIPDEAEVRARWGDFAWTRANAAQAAAIIARYPAGR
ncbi:MAG: NAD(P)H-dependent oxidoreductase subunit E, partial [Sphingopyxis sp.]|nr:NAD(P)H-dependent oxidoreductase subunit E [Sphingopyxis sp.]